VRKEAERLNPLTPSEIVTKNLDVLVDYCSEWGFMKLCDEMILSAALPDDKAVVKIANQIWWKLPDHRKIRDEGFFILCDIAEHMFDE
jgi:hypothetical protein